ncbi:MAG: hypothetical protein OIN88_15745 [Candidatus Methanoperedens sp.]|nr:hypothetical protein [Candidatus Methanoperedens sp.]
MNTQDDKEKDVSKDTVYSEFYNEMRRFRDYELTASTWYMAILLAITGFILSAKFDSGQSTQSNLSQLFIAYRSHIFFLIIIIGGSALFSICYATRRYRELRDYADGNLEPEWKKKTFKHRKHKYFNPRNAIILSLIVVLVIDGLILFF